MKRMLTLMAAILLFLLPCAASAEQNHAVAYMESRFTCGCSRSGTGTMIGRRGLVTAAHNLYCHQHGEPLKSCNFYFGAVSANSCWYRYDGKFRYTVYETFQDGYSSRNDIGYVVFDTPVGDETGWFGYIVGSDYDLNEEYTHVLSYDGKRHLQSYFEVQYVLNSTQIYWEGWVSGNDGGPVYFDSSDINGPYVVAVYTSYDNEGNNYARRLTNNVIRDMREDGAFD